MFKAIFAPARAAYRLANTASTLWWLWLIAAALFLALSLYAFVVVVLAAVCLFLGLWGFVQAHHGRPRAASDDDRPVSVRIDRNPIWHNFNYKAYIVEVHVAVTNQTDVEVELSGFQSHTTGNGTLAHSQGDIEVVREVERYKQQRSQITRHSLIEAGQTESGWWVVAVPFSADEPKLPTLTIKVSGYREPFEAWQ